MWSSLNKSFVLRVTTSSTFLPRSESAVSLFLNSSRAIVAVFSISFSAFLKVIPFAVIYDSTGGEQLTVITLNLIIAVALLFSPFIASQLCDGVSLSVGDTLRKGALKAVTVGGPKAMAVVNALDSTQKMNSASSQFGKYKNFGKYKK